MEMIKTNQSGMSALLTVLIIGASTLVMVISLMGISNDDISTSFIREKKEEIGAGLEGCRNEALAKLRFNPMASGTDMIRFGRSVCKIEILDEAGVKKVLIKEMGRAEDMDNIHEMAYYIEGGVSDNGLNINLEKSGEDALLEVNNRMSSFGDE